MMHGQKNIKLCF